MELEEDSWVDPELREYFADVVYRVKWLDSQGGSGEVYLYLLFEHKSHSDRTTAHQILRYMMLKWNAHLKTESPQLPLPYIIPLVFYHGEANWTASRTFQGLFGDKIPAELQPYVPHFSYELLDLSPHSTRQIVGGPRVAVTFSVMHSVFTADLKARVPDILKALANGMPGDIELLKLILLYLMTVSSLSQSDLSAAVNSAYQGNARDVMPTLAETLLQQGEERGIQKGIEEGRQQGVHTGSLAIVLRAVQRKFGSLDPAILASLEQLSTTDLELLIDDLPNFTSTGDLREWLAKRLPAL